jgi:hypothetical protein
LSNKLKINKVGRCIYMKNTDKCYVIVYLYVDDMFILDSNDHMIKSNIKMSSYQLNKFDIKNLDTIDVKL